MIIRRLALSLLCLGALPGAIRAAEATVPPPATPVDAPRPPPAPPVPPSKADVEALIAKAQDYLLAQQQADGSFVPGGARLALGVTGLTTTALAMAPGLPASDPHVAAAVAFILKHKNADGGIYSTDEGLNTYGTAVSVIALQATGNLDAPTAKAAREYLYTIQVTDPESASFGGLGYGRKASLGRGDLSNSHLAFTAFHLTGLDNADPHAKAAVTFLEHCQQLSSHNKLPWVDMSEKQAGGGIYNPETHRPAPPAGTPAPAVPPAPLHPTAYASMTYALVTSYLDFGVDAQDERVAAAIAWLKANYSPYSNPGRAAGHEVDGLYYGYWIMARTFQQLKYTTFTLSDGKKVVDWRTDIFGALTFRAKSADLGGGKTGTYWVNETKTWGETNPTLATAYVLEVLKRINATL